MLQNKIVLCEVETTFYTIIIGNHEAASSMRNHSVWELWWMKNI